MNENNVNITNVNNNVVNIPRQSRGAGTVLLFVFFWWLLPWWWLTLITAWLVWLIIDGVIAIFDPEFFLETWFYPLPFWLFGIR
jgi:hypothetical protein